MRDITYKTMEMVTANLVREGINKHKARELAEHFYSFAAAQPAPVQPVGTYGEIHESMQALLRSGLQRDQQIYMAMKDRPLYTTPPAAPVPTSWMEMVTANLVRGGVNKHKARELAEHFYSLKEKNT